TVAAQGFRELEQAMRRAAKDGSSALDRLKLAGLAYVKFALRRPEHFTAMFDAPASFKTGHADSKEAAEQAFGSLVNLVKRCQNEGQLPSGDPVEFALLAWTMVHGVAKLGITGRLPYRSKGGVVKFAEFVINESLPLSKRASTIED